MRERDLSVEHELPFFVPEWGHPVYPPQWGSLEVDVIGRVAGGFWEKSVLAAEPEPMFIRTRRGFIGFRLVRAT